ncbi:MAG: YicC family protein [Breznakibacter sp.]|nr:YicC family protein [Breznakibacter sp.]
MIQSMTGYGKSVCEFPTKKITIEIKSLNSKQLDLSVRVPSSYREKEIELRNEISKHLFRGKIECGIYIENLGNDKTVLVNQAVASNYYHQLTDLCGKLQIEDRSHILKIIMGMPDVISKSETIEIDENEWKEIVKQFNVALQNINDFRNSEGAVLEQEIRMRIALISELLEQVTPFELARIEKIKSKISESLKEFAEKQLIDQNRFEQELIYYLEKIDVTEEKVRLKSHIEYFLETIVNEPQPGKKLGFIAQEMGREINTLGSKANDSDMQHIVIRMKDELEKIKEQILNIL